MKLMSEIIAFLSDMGQKEFYKAYKNSIDQLLGFSTNDEGVDATPALSNNLNNQEIQQVTDQIQKIIDSLYLELNSDVKKLNRIIVKEFLRDIINVQDSLKAMLANNLKKSTDGYRGEAVQYSQEQIQLSEVFLDLTSETKLNDRPGGSTVIKDIYRGVTLNNKKFGVDFAKFVNEGQKSTDIMIRKEIQELTGDEIDAPNSIANKIFNFGGQYLQALLMIEFSNSTKLGEQKVYGQICEGTINWKKSHNDVIGELCLKIFSVISDDQHYVLGTDGEKLENVTPNNNRSKFILNSLKRNHSLRVPISVLDVKLQSVTDDNGVRYFKVAESNVQYNAPELDYDDDLLLIEPLVKPFMKLASKLHSSNKRNSLLLQDFSNLIDGISKAVTPTKSFSDVVRHLSKLVKSKYNVIFNLEDLQKINAIKDLVSNNSSNSLISKKMVDFTSALSYLLVPPALSVEGSPEITKYAKNLLLRSKAKDFMNKILTARDNIKNNKANFNQDQLKVVDRVIKILNCAHKELNEALPNPYVLSAELIENQKSSISRELDIASTNAYISEKPSDNFLIKILELIKVFFRGKSPSLSSDIENLKTELDRDDSAPNFKGPSVGG